MSDLLDHNPREPRWRLAKADLIPFACFGICFFILLFCITWSYLVPESGSGLPGSTDISWWYRTVRMLLGVCAVVSVSGLLYGLLNWRKAGRVGKSATFGNAIFSGLTLVTLVPLPFIYTMY
jgi:hypothetical protein